MRIFDGGKTLGQRLKEVDGLNPRSRKRERFFIFLEVWIVVIIWIVLMVTMFLYK